MSGTAGFDLGEVLKEAIALHSCRKCRFKDGAAERLIASPEFAALAARLEEEEEECVLKTGALEREMNDGMTNAELKAANAAYRENWLAT